MGPEKSLGDNGKLKPRAVVGKKAAVDATGPLSGAKQYGGVERTVRLLELWMRHVKMAKPPPRYALWFKELRNGFVVAECLKQYYPNAVSMHSFDFGIR